MIKYYFYLYFHHPYNNRPLFVVTPVEYFDRKGFLADTEFQRKDVYWPMFLERYADSYYKPLIPINEALVILRQSRNFEELDMVQAIGLRYEKSREGGGDPLND